MSKQLQRRNRWYDRANDIKPHAEVLSEAITAAGTATGVSDWGKLLADASEAFEIYGAAVLLGASEALPAVKAILKVIELVTKEHDPNKVGFLACTLAYQQALVTAASSPKFQVNATSEQRKKALKICNLIVKAMPEELTFTNCTISSLVQHPLLLNHWEPRIREVFEALGMSSNDAEQRILDIRQAFPGHLQTLLYHGKTADKFKLFRDILRSSDGTVNPADVLREYAQYHRWLYEERPVLGTAPFSLQKIYLETHCRKLTWKEVRDTRVNLYESGTRAPLTKTVLGLMEDPRFDELIVVQGQAGCGKSAFTLDLNALLLQQGWVPIRILLRYIKPELELLDALSDAMRYDEVFRETIDIRHATGENVFEDEKVFASAFEQTTDQKEKRAAKICPYVLILDGWDEVTVAGSRSFQERLEKILREVRNTFIGRGGHTKPLVRVIVTGRPSTAYLGESNVLKNETPVLTVQPLEPGQLTQLFSDIQKGLSEPLTGPGVAPEEWQLPTPAELERLQEGLKKRQQNQELEVLESPLLSLITLRLLGKKHLTVEQALDNPTRLLRALVDETCPYGGNAGSESLQDLSEQVRLHGNELRALLRETAAAMTLYGQEAIPYKDLELRLGYLIPNFTELSDEVERRTRGSLVASLLIAFFFKDSNKELGAEFHHKSFREYLFAECILQRLLDAAGEADGEEKPEKNLQERLAELLAPQWLTPEVKQHLKRIIALQFEEAPTAYPWDELRYRLTKTWAWWYRQEHLKPNLVRNRHRQTERVPALVEELVEWAIQERRDQPGERPSYTAMDSHLGDALIEFTVYFHTALDSVPFSKKHPYFHANIGEETRFSPEGGKRQYPFRYTINRIAATPQRPIWGMGEDYPIQADLTNALLAEADLMRAPLANADLTNADLTKADLTNADLVEATLTRATLTRATLAGATLAGANLTDADLTGANLVEANLVEANLMGANLTVANLTNADLVEANLTNADLTDADLTNADLTDADLTDADLTNADLTDTDLTRAWVWYDGKYVSLPEALRWNLEGIPKGLPEKLIKELKAYQPTDEDDISEIEEDIES